MHIKKIFAVCLSLLLFSASGCSAPAGKKTVSSSVSSATESSSSAAPQESSSSFASEAASSAQSESPKLVSSKQVSSPKNSSGNTSSAPKVSSKKEQSDSGWVAYDTNKDGYKLHIRKKDGTGDKVIVNDSVLAPCVAGDWVYFFSDLSTIEKVRLDGSQRAKVCNTPDIMEINGSTAVTAEYKEGYIFYKTQQMQEVGDNSSYPAHYYKLYLNGNKLIPVK